MTKDVSYKVIAEQVLDLIRSGVFPPTSRLPVQNELAKILGVSRGTVREAMIVLDAQGHVQLRGRSGTYVLDTYTSAPMGLPKVTPLELTEARALFEAESAALAAPIMDEDTIAELEKYIAIMSGQEDTDMTPDEADYAFHNVIAHSTENKMIIFVIESMWKIRTENKELQQVYQSVCDKDSSHREREHLAILEAIKNRNPVAARKAMREHFTTIIQALLEASEKEAFEAIQLQASENRSRFFSTLKMAL